MTTGDSNGGTGAKGLAKVLEIRRCAASMQTQEVWLTYIPLSYVRYCWEHVGKLCRKEMQRPGNSTRPYLRENEREEIRSDLNFW